MKRNPAFAIGRTSLAKSANHNTADPTLADLDKHGSTPFEYLTPFLFGAAVFGLTLWAWNLLSSAELKVAEVRFEAEVSRVEEEINNRMASYEQVLRGAAGLFNASTAVSRSEWHGYIDTLDIANSFPGTQGIGFSKLVRPVEKAAHTKQIISQGFPGYKIWPEGERSSYTSIIFLEPFDDRNRRAFGYDMFSEANRRSAMEGARDTGQRSISRKVLLGPGDNDLALEIHDGWPVSGDTRMVSIGNGTQTSLFTRTQQIKCIRSYELGVNSYIRKPIDFGEFADAVAQVGLYWLLLNRMPTGEAIS